MPEIPNNKNIIDLIRELFQEVITLFAQHIALLKKEFSENAVKVVRAVVMMILALVIAYVGFIFIGALAVYLLSMVIPSWVALIIVTALYLLTPLAMVIYGINLLKNVFSKPKEIVSEFKKTGEESEKWLKNLKK